MESHESSQSLLSECVVQQGRRLAKEFRGNDKQEVPVCPAAALMRVVMIIEVHRKTERWRDCTVPFAPLKPFSCSEVTKHLMVSCLIGLLAFAKKKGLFPFAFLCEKVLFAK